MHLTESKIPYPKQFGFQTGHSTEHGIVQLVDQILESFEYNNSQENIWVFLLNYVKLLIQILLKKLELSGVTDRNHSRLKNYLLNRKQFIQINDEENTELETVTCGIPQG